MASAPSDTITSTSPAGAADAMMPVTITHLILIGIAIALTIAMIWWGQKLWRKRSDGLEALDERGDTAEVGAPEPSPGGAPPAEASRVADVVQPPLEAPVPIEPAAPVPAPPPPVAPAPPPLAETLPASPPAAAPRGDLTLLKGLGPKAAAMLAERGIADIEDLAALLPDQAAALDADLGPFRGRMARDRWHEQARLLAGGDRAQYETIFGNLGAK